jgi:hypothetical protein
MKKVLFTFTILALLTSIYVFYPDNSSPNIVNIDTAQLPEPPEPETDKLIEETPLVMEQSSLEKKDTAVFLLDVSVEIELKLSVKDKVSNNNNEVKQAFYLFAHRTSQNNKWRMGIQPLDESKQIIIGVPISYVDVIWNDNHSIASIDLLEIDEKHPNSKISDILWQMSFLESSKKQASIPFSGENLKYTYQTNKNSVSRALNGFNKKVYETVIDKWTLTQKSDEVLTGIDKIKFYLNLESKSNGKGQAILAFNLLVQNVSDSYAGTLPDFKLGNQLPNSEFNVYAKQMRDEQEAEVLITSKDDVIKYIGEFATSFDADMLKEVGEYAIKMDILDLKLLLDAEGLTDKKQSFLTHAIELAGGEAANALLLTLMEDKTLSVANRYRSMLSLGNLPEQSIDNFNAVKALALESGIDSALMHNAAIQMVNIARKIDSETIELSKQALNEYLEQDGAHREAYLVSLGQLNSADDYLTVLDDLKSDSSVAKSAAAKIVVNSALLNVTEAIDLVKKEYILEENAQVLTAYNVLIAKSDFNDDFYKGVYAVIEKTNKVAARRIRLEALTSTSNACIQHQEFLELYVGSTNVHPDNVKMVKSRCVNLGYF